MFPSSFEPRPFSGAWFKWSEESDELVQRLVALQWAWRELLDDRRPRLSADDGGLSGARSQKRVADSGRRLRADSPLLKPMIRLAE
jgi:hypothetical protein